MYEFRMPSLGADMKAATLIEWKVKPGDRVSRGDIIAELETEKGDIDVEVFEDGVIDQLIVQPGNKLPVGTVLARIKQEGGEIPLEEKRDGEKVQEQELEEEKPAITRPGYDKETVQERLRVRASPLAKRVASELGVDLSKVKGTGPNGAIEKADVERAADDLKKVEKQPEIVSEVTEKRTIGEQTGGMRQAIAAAMSRSNREIPHYFLKTDINMSETLKWLEAENQKREIKERLLPAVILIKAVSKALNDVPELNGYWKNDQLEIQDAIHIGFAISLRKGGLIAPAIHHVDLKSLDELMKDMLDLTMRARTGKLRSSELTDSTITITNLGDRGVETVFGVIYPPQVALIGFGKISERPWAENGMLGVKKILTVTLSADHRATDGHKGAVFLEKLKHYLQDTSCYE